MRLVILLLTTFIFSAAQAQDEIEWTDFETAVDLNKKDKKPFFIDMYTDWCGWCAKMHHSTFKDPEVVKFINKNFHAVRFNPETVKSVAYRGKLYEIKKYPKYKNKSYNELALSLMDGKMGFPTFVVLSKKEVKMGTIPGYQAPGVLIAKLKAMAKVK